MLIQVMSVPNHPSEIKNENSQRGYRLLFLLVQWTVWLALGLMLYWVCVRAGASRRSSAGWFVSVGLFAVSFSSDGSKAKRYSWALIPWVIFFLFDQRWLDAATNFLRNPVPASVHLYAVASIKELVILFLWIILFPDEFHRFPSPARIRQFSQIILFIVGVVAGATALYEMDRVLRNFRLSPVDQFRWVQTWTAAAVLGLYAIMGIRVLVPHTIAVIMARTRFVPDKGPG